MDHDDNDWVEEEIRVPSFEILERGMHPSGVHKSEREHKIKLGGEKRAHCKGTKLGIGGEEGKSRGH